MGLFDGINEATTGGRRYLDPGVYVVKIVRCGAKTAQESGRGVASFFVELEVMQSDQKSCPAGTVASWATPFKGGMQQKIAISNIKQFLAAALGVMTIFDTPDPATGKKMSAEAAADAAVSSANPFAGKLVGVKVTPKTTREGKDFSQHTWFPCS